MSTDKREGNGAMHEPARLVESVRVYASNQPAEKERNSVVAEQVLSIEIKDAGTYNLMYTPVDAIALAVGFAFTESFIEDIDDISVLARCEDNPNVIRMQLGNIPEGKTSSRNMTVLSSCGMCGREQSLEELVSSLPAVGWSLGVAKSFLVGLPEALSAGQRLYEETGGTHAAGIFSPDGEIVAFAEDIGRHNALDKAIGKCLLEKRAMAGCGVVLSSRVSFELVVKSARAGLELIAGVSAPSSLAIDAARKCNITLCGFVREGRAGVYTHPGRIQDLEADAIVESSSE